MAFYRLEYDFKDDKELFEDLYTNDDQEQFDRGLDGTYEGFIRYYSDNEVIDMTGKILISVRGIGNYFGHDAFTPIKIMTLFYDDGDKYGYKPELIYSGHISFLKINRDNGDIQYFYKDDECRPQTWEEFLNEHSSALYEAQERGYSIEDVQKQIEMFIRANIDFYYTFNAEDVYVVEGL